MFWLSYGHYTGTDKRDGEGRGGGGYIYTPSVSTQPNRRMASKPQFLDNLVFSLGGLNHLPDMRGVKLLRHVVIVGLLLNSVGVGDGCHCGGMRELADYGLRIMDLITGSSPRVRAEECCKREERSSFGVGLTWRVVGGGSNACGYETMDCCSERGAARGDMMFSFRDGCAIYI